VRKASKVKCRDDGQGQDAALGVGTNGVWAFL
jgi:hypothetical protein